MDRTKQRKQIAKLKAEQDIKPGSKEDTIFDLARLFDAAQVSLRKTEWKKLKQLGPNTLKAIKYGMGASYAQGQRDGFNEASQLAKEEEETAH